MFNLLIRDCFLMLFFPSESFTPFDRGLYCGLYWMIVKCEFYAIHVFQWSQGGQYHIISFFLSKCSHIFINVLKFNLSLAMFYSLSKKYYIPIKLFKNTTQSVCPSKVLPIAHSCKHITNNNMWCLDFFVFVYIYLPASMQTDICYYSPFYLGFYQLPRQTSDSNFSARRF